MAAVTTGRNNSGIFWINDTSDEEQAVIFVPGVSRERSLRTAFKSGSLSGSNSYKRTPTMRAKCGIESRSESSKGKAGKKQAQSSSLSSRDTTKEKHVIQSTSSSVVPSPTPGTQNRLTSSQDSEVMQAKSKTSLKDLCPEDKQRIANLIQELARVSEEKDESVQKLRDEQGLFERKIQHLEQQNTLIIQERESLQQQYRECQELLGLYQQYLSQQQEKLNQSIAQRSHSHSHSKVSAGQGSCSRPTTRSASRTVLDSSYLSMPGHSAGRGGAASCHASPPLSTLSPSATPPDSSSGERTLSERTIVQRCGGTRRKPRPTSFRCHTTVGCNTDPALAGSPTHHDAVSTQEHPIFLRNPPIDEDVAGTLTAPQLGREDWEEKRHLLLLQKMQLEVEREKLQARLVQQEDRLLRQNRQLRQSRLDYSRFQQSTATELGQAISRKALLKHDPPLNSHVADSEQIAPGEDMVEDKHLACEGRSHQSSLKAPVRPASPPRGTASTPRRPASPPMVHPRTPHARLDSSLMELLEVFSPISVPQLGRPPVPPSTSLLYQPPPSGPRHACPALLSPSQGCYPRTPQHDLEESQILEEIFFIC